MRSSNDDYVSSGSATKGETGWTKVAHISKFQINYQLFPLALFTDLEDSLRLP